MVISALRARALNWVHTRRLGRVLKTEHGIKDIREFGRQHWHCGTRHYTGVMRSTGEDVFIKNGESDLVRREVRVMARLAAGDGARFLARLFAADESGVLPFIACERIAGGTLADAIERGDAALLARAAGEIVQIVDALNRAGLVHRDLRPANLLLREADHPSALVLIDFAFSIVDDEAGDDLPLDVLRTLGDGLQPAPFTWDDAYSAHMIMQQLERAVQQRFGETNQLQCRIGRRVHVLPRSA